MMTFLLIAATLLSVEKNGLSLSLTSETQVIDPGRSVFMTLSVTAPAEVTVALPDLRERVRGFQLAEEFAEPAKKAPDGSTVHVVQWKLVPEACAQEYRIAPFVVTASPRLLSSREDEGALSFVAGPVYFDPPAVREAVTGGMETDPQKDLPPLSWKLAGFILAGLAGAGALLAGLYFLVRLIVRRIKEHRMSPIERAWVELDRLIRKGLPGRGRYKDFYVELTMVVRRYVQRKYGVRAPHLTTEEFLRACEREGHGGQAQRLKRFLESADMVKFAGVQATPEMADDATESARGYLKGDAGAEGVA